MELSQTRDRLDNEQHAPQNFQGGLNKSALKTWHELALIWPGRLGHGRSW